MTNGQANIKFRTNPTSFILTLNYLHIKIVLLGLFCNAGSHKYRDWNVMSFKCHKCHVCVQLMEGRAIRNM